MRLQITALQQAEAVAEAEGRGNQTLCCIRVAHVRRHRKDGYRKNDAVERANSGDEAAEGEHRHSAALEPDLHLRLRCWRRLHDRDHRRLLIRDHDRLLIARNYAYAA